MISPFVEESFTYKGYPCMVLFMPMAFRCGYVGLPKESRFYQKECDSIPVECHCGLTYASSNLYGQEDKDIWWIGFDCCHYCDGFDSEKANEYFKDSKEAQRYLLRFKCYHSYINKDRGFRTLDYVKENCRRIVEQIILLEKGENIL